MSLQKLIGNDTENLIVAVRELLQEFSLDWYVSVMGKSERPEGHSTGIAAKIHNEEMTRRMSLKITNLKEAYRQICEESK